jgi:imidazolonepropionase-like amidohydrolase
VETYQEGYAAVIAAGAAGYDLVKVYNSVSKDAYAGVIAAANEVSLPVVGHVPFSVGLHGAIDAGQKSIEHLRGYVFEVVPASAPIQANASMKDRAVAWNYADRSKFESLVAATRDAGVWNCPTLVDMQHWSLPSQEYAELFSRTEVRYLSHRSRSWLVDRSKGWLADFSEDDFEAARRALAVKKEFVGALHDAGAGILLGTDDWMRGFAIVDELENLVDAGLSPHEAIKAGTRSAAEFLSASDEFGTVAVGMRADLLLLGGNPLDDVNNVRAVSGVMLRGKWLPRKDLDEILEAIAVLIRTSVIG